MDIKDDRPCPLSPVEVNNRDHKLRRLDEEVMELRSDLNKSNEMIKEIHDKIVNGSSYLNGIKHGGVLVICGVIIFCMGLISLLTGKISFSDFLKIVS